MYHTMACNEKIRLSYLSESLARERMCKLTCFSSMKIVVRKRSCFFQSETSSQNDGHLAVSLESLSSSVFETNYQPPIAYFGIFYPTITAPTPRARRQMYSALICYLCSFFIVIVVYTILILLSKKFEQKS